MPEELGQRRLRAEADHRRWHALCGTRLYCIATLAGTFPDTGWHVPDEMGGIWAPPIKLLDGYWLGLRQRGGEPLWLTSPATWQAAADGVTYRYALPALGLDVMRQDWIVPDERVLVVEVCIRQTEPEPQGAMGPRLECGLVVRSDLRGIWLSEERLGEEDGDDAVMYHDELGAISFHDSVNPSWMVCAGRVDARAEVAPSAHALGRDVWGPERTAGRGTGAALWWHMDPTTARPATLRFLIAGPGRDQEPATAVFRRYLRSAAAPDTNDTSQGESGAQLDALEDAHRQAVEAFRVPFERCVLDSPDARLNDVFAWSKATTRSMMVDVTELGRAPMGGLPDYPWWFGCDIAYGVLPMLPAGQTCDAVDALRTLAAISRRHNGTARIIHEAVTNGVVTSPGNLVETALFARALYHTYRWSGDRSLLADLFPFCLEGILEYALGTQLEPGELVPQGRSMAETPDAHGGVQTLDVGAYIAEALDLLGELSLARQEAAQASAFHSRAAALREHMREQWWLPEQSFFGDLRASRTELEAMLRRFEAMAAPDDSVLLSIERLRQALASGDDYPPDVRHPWLFLHYVQALAAEAGMPSRQQATALLARMETPEWTERYGIVLNSATDRRVMTLPTGALATAEARYGRADEALSYIERLVASFGAATPGTISEFSPDAGCFMQLWSSYGIVWPVVHYFFGLRPDAGAQRLVCVPQLPAAWPTARLTAIPIGDALVDVAIERTADGQRLTVDISDPAWEVALGMVAPPGAAALHASLNSAPTTLRPGYPSELEQRDIVLAPPASGATRYTLAATWTAREPAQLHASPLTGHVRNTDAS